ncbi:MAG: YqcC family protein [Aeromonadaceae bacterium]
MDRDNQAQHLLRAIEQELIALELWQQEAPAAEALASQLPFCVDTLAFHQWLQFVLLARLQQMLQQQLPLPSQIALYPMATEVYKEELQSKQTLLELLAQLDECLTGRAVTR